MKTSILRALFGQLWQPRHVHPPGPADELVVIAPLQFRRALNELARLKRAVALQTSDGSFLGSGRLTTDAIEGVTVHLPWDGDEPLPQAWAWPINATASGPDGLVLFTLQTGMVDASGRVSAAWPDQMIRVQSRRHFRLSALGGAQRRAWLRWQVMDVGLPVRDLSEDGVCVEVATGMNSGLEPLRAAQLHLDGEVLDVPVLEVVHTRTGRHGAPTWVSARMVGLGEAQRRALRRWMAAMQAGTLAAPGDQA